VLWTVFGINPFPVALASFIGLSILWGIVYVVLKPRQDTRSLPEKAEQPLADQREDVFETEFLPKNGLRLGETVKFKVNFKGFLKAGGFQTEMIPPKGKLIHAPCEKTFSRRARDFLTKGKLNGLIQGKYEWEWPIPNKGPPGEWTFLIRAYQRTPYRSWWVSFRIFWLVLLKGWLIESIDLDVLDQPHWTWVTKEHKTLITE
jgi:hypothetical protein